MPPYAWGSLAFLLVASAAGIAFAAVRGLDTWRTLRGFQGRLEPELAEVNGLVATMEAKLAIAPDGPARLQRATTRLQASIAEARIIADAAQDARSVLRVIRFLRK